MNKIVTKPTNPKNPSNLHPISKFFVRFKLVMPLVTIAIIAGGTYLAIQIGKGYRPTTKGLTGTGLLAANSFPPGAEVYIDGKLTTATDDTLNLTPGTYTVNLKKDGYLPWEKKILLNKELVTQTNATLFKAIASLTPLTLNGATNVVPSPDGQKLVYVVATASATAKNGLYISDLSSSPLSLQRGPRQIAKTPTHFNLAEATLLWSPNSSQIMIHADTKAGQFNYLLEADRLNELDALPDVTPQLSIILAQWEEDIVLRETKQFALLPPEMQHIATQSATNFYFSPNEDRVMYTATGYAVIPENLIPKTPSPSTQPEVRSLEPGHLYVYDLVEDRNYDFGMVVTSPETMQKNMLLASQYQQSGDDAASRSAVAAPKPTATGLSTPILSAVEGPIPITSYNRLYESESFDKTAMNFKVHYSSIYIDGFQWYPNSTHIIMTSGDRVEVVEFDATNRATIYSGPFTGNFVYPWPDGSKLIFMTNLNPATSSSINLYTVDIR